MGEHKNKSVNPANPAGKLGEISRQQLEQWFVEVSNQNNQLADQLAQLRAALSSRDFEYTVTFYNMLMGVIDHSASFSAERKAWCIEKMEEILDNLSGDKEPEHEGDKVES